MQHSYDDRVIVRDQIDDEMTWTAHNLIMDRSSLATVPDMIKSNAGLKIWHFVRVEELRIGVYLSDGYSEQRLVSLKGRVAEIFHRPFESILDVVARGGKMANWHQITVLRESLFGRRPRIRP